MTAAYLRDVLGFDLSYATRAGATVRCSQCAVVAINGVPAHEHGCPNQTRECAGCNARVPFNVKYCTDCR